MIQSRKALIFALFFPILSLAALTVYKRYILLSGEEITLPISGYDPRDLLSGHYLVYQVEYGVSGLCYGDSMRKTAYVCLDPKNFSHSPPVDCKTFIKGVCNGGRFEAGIERFYVPESKASDLEKQVRSKNASIILSINRNGQAQVKTLLINGQQWDTQ